LAVEEEEQNNIQYTWINLEIKQKFTRVKLAEKLIHQTTLIYLGQLFSSCNYLAVNCLQNLKIMR